MVLYCLLMFVMVQGFVFGDEFCFWFWLFGQIFQLEGNGNVILFVLLGWILLEFVDYLGQGVVQVVVWLLVEQLCGVGYVQFIMVIGQLDYEGFDERFDVVVDGVGDDIFDDVLGLGVGGGDWFGYLLCFLVFVMDQVFDQILQGFIVFSDGFVDQ